MEIILIQNNHAFNLFIFKTRRYRSLIKLRFTPLLVGLTYKKFFMLLSKPITNHNICFIGELQKYYLNMNIWLYYKDSINNNFGLMSNGIHKSYNFWMIKNNYDLLFSANKTQIYKLTVPFTNYVKHVRLLHFTVLKHTLKQSFILVLKVLLKLYTPYINISRNTYGFLIVNHAYDFLLFYNFYYFKVHNY